jgi:diguanylate cyclase (GGDEF)-like protein/PAS domain S-box-containing protein
MNLHSHGGGMTHNYRSVFESLYDGVYFVDLKRTITYWNPAAERLTGFSAKEVVGSSCMDNILIHIDESGRGLCKGPCPLAATMQDGEARRSEVYLHHKDGHRVPVSVRTTPLRDDAGNIVGGVELFSDISSKKAMQEKIRELEKLALIDGLTGLSNRKHIEGELAARFQEKVRYGLEFGVLFMDVDHFKGINDAHGHAGGDAALKTISATFRASARSYDLVGRWGGEEFVGIIRNVDSQILHRVGERYRVLVENTKIKCPGSPFSVTISVGATLATSEDTPGTLIARADELLYESKQNGRNRVTMRS